MLAGILGGRHPSPSAVSRKMDVRSSSRLGKEEEK